MTKKVAGSLPESGLSQTEGDSGAHSSGASSSADNLGAGETKDSASHTEDAEVEEPDSGPSKGKGLSQETPSTSGGTQDSEATSSDNASLSSDDATPIANGSVAGLEWAQPDHDEDHFDDADSALGDDSASSTQSLSSSILQYRMIHGRRYHSLRGDGDTEYW
ncbi:S-adenosyl-L-methionine-dependent methyltransferase [Apiospora saccharicola]|uniref:S-adenosyl-L-methionine-dependent methyltransferase n=1 Tax=Apiospora saccharicola TaxID=335842 RepID=A0ABR1WIS0_9PEZI